MTHTFVSTQHTTCIRIYGRQIGSADLHVSYCVNIRFSLCVQLTRAISLQICFDNLVMMLVTDRGILATAQRK